MIKVGINGLEKIGCPVFGAGTKRDDIVTAINDTFIDVAYAAYMLKYDTMHCHFDGAIEVDANA